MTSVQFQPGDLVTARGREWVVLPETHEDLVMVRPLGGIDEEVTGILPSIEEIVSTSFGLPDPSILGDLNACRLLRDASRLSTRSAAGPFRSFGRIAVEPRPYQLVPLLMAMRLDPVRMLIADDVGIGKTIESCLIAKELIERGEVDGLAVLCPPHLAEQWQRELQEKFHIDAELVLRSTANRLERGQRHAGESVFARHRFVIVSIDYIKAARRIDDFVQNCPSLVIIDEAHGCTLSGGRGSTGRQMRHTLATRLCEDPDRHVMLVTATPHTGNEDAFRSLIALLDPEFGNLSDDLDKTTKEALKRKLAKHLVQRKRDDVKDYLGSTEFPTRLEAEDTYTLDPEYKILFDNVLNFAHELVTEESGSKVQQRVRWWSALALLRALASSPAAAAATLRNRASNADATSVDEADELGRREVLDQDETENEDVIDFTPGGLADDLPSKSVKRLKDMATQADGLHGKKDAKLQKTIKVLKGLLKDGKSPIVFCRFINTAEYVAEELRLALPNTIEVSAITGSLPPKEREDRIKELGEHSKYILVCTDCLSEGVNLQDNFDSVIHYDLSWNPTRHEQREGRVDRFGQEKKEVKVLTLYGEDNLIDVVILNVLHRKHKAIRSQLGISISIPSSTTEVVENLYDHVIRRISGDKQLVFDFHWEKTEALHTEWEERAKKISRSVFAQQTISPDEVEKELVLVQNAIGTAPTVSRFLRDVFNQLNIPVTETKGDHVEVHVTEEAPRSLRNAIGTDDSFKGRFVLPTQRDELYLARTHPIIEGLASWVLDTALDPIAGTTNRKIAARCGVALTSAVTERTAILLLRIRHHLIISGRSESTPLLAEEIVPVAFTGTSESPSWLEDKSVESLLTTPSAGNVSELLSKQQAEHLVGEIPALAEVLNEIALQRAELQRDSHTRVRQSSKQTGKVEVLPVLPVDILGAYVLLPSEGGN